MASLLVTQLVPIQDLRNTLEMSLPVLKEAGITQAQNFPGCLQIQPPPMPSPAGTNVLSVSDKPAWFMCHIKANDMVVT